MFLFWNVRGLNGPQKQYQLKKFLGNFKGHIVCLLEIHVRLNMQASILQRLKPGWACIDNYAHVELGRNWVLHDSGISLQEFHSSSQAIHCHVFSAHLPKYYFLSVIYASNSDMERKILWQDLAEVKSNMPSVPWLAMGDFNVIKTMEERSDFFPRNVLPFLYPRLRRVPPEP